jgi:hypothetical protein
MKYDGKTNPSAWLEDYHLACRAGGVDDDLLIIQFLTIYLVDTSRDWLDHLPKNSIDCWEDLKEIFTSNFQGTSSCPAKAGGIPVGLHLVLLPKVSRTPQDLPCRCHLGVLV